MAKIRDMVGQWVKITLPTGRTEWLLFAVAFLVYIVLSVRIATYTTLIFDHRIPWDAYFSFDNRSIVLTGGGYERHPLSIYFFDALRQLGLVVSAGKYDASFRIFLGVCSAICMALSVLYVFKYISRVIGLAGCYALLLSAFFGLFSTSLLLSFTPENYTFTMPILLWLVLYTGLCWRNRKSENPVVMGLSAIILGGFTITNFIQPYLHAIAHKKFWTDRRSFLTQLGYGAASALVFLLLLGYRIHYNFSAFFAKTGEQYEKFSQQKSTPYWDMVFSWFWGGNMIFPAFTLMDYRSKSGFAYKAIFMDTFAAVLPNIILVLLLVLVLWAIIRGRKMIPVIQLSLIFLYAIGLHVALRFGLRSAYIYGAHFIFIVPLLLGWLLRFLEPKKHWHAGMVAFLVCLLVYFAVNNALRLQEFFDFGLRYHRV